MKSHGRFGRLLALLLTFALASVARGGTISGPMLNPSNGQYYYLLSEDTWTNAETQSGALGGHLTTINDAAENSWVLSTFGSFEGVNRNLWIGYYDPSGTGVFSWASGDSNGYTQWASGEPNYSTQERFTMILSPTVTSLGYWNNYYDAPIAPYTGLGGVYPSSPNCGVVEVLSLPTVVPLPSAHWMGASIFAMTAVSRFFSNRRCWLLGLNTRQVQY